jgi:hypothetical protein
MVWLGDSLDRVGFQDVNSDQEVLNNSTLYVSWRPHQTHKSYITPLNWKSVGKKSIDVKIKKSKRSTKGYNNKLQNRMRIILKYPKPIQKWVMKGWNLRQIWENSEWWTW